MLNVTIVEPQKIVDNTYRERINYLISHTQANYGATPLGKAKHQEPSFDAGQVCCWMCEKPLANGMRMCHVRKNNIELIPEPTYEENLDFDFGERPLDAELHDIQLICGDCSEGLSLSINNVEKLRQLILDSKRTPVTYPKLYQHYIWPNRIYHVLNDTVKVLSRRNKELQDLSQGTVYSSDQCFIYTEKVAWIKYLGKGKIVDEKFESRVFVEPNPGIPEPLQIMAQNTIRLFRLNGIHYYHGLDHHEIHYHLSESHTQYDDLRLAGRGKAFDRAHTALNQFKTAREFDQGLYNVLLDQQKIIMELNGYRSVWAAVFNDGNDPGGLAALFDTNPLPVAPTEISDSTNQGKMILEKRDVIHLRQGPTKLTKDTLLSVRRLGQKMTYYGRIQPDVQELEKFLKEWSEKANEKQSNDEPDSELPPSKRQKVQEVQEVLEKPKEKFAKGVLNFCGIPSKAGGIFVNAYVDQFKLFQ